MANKINVKHILELHDADISTNVIALFRHISRSTRFESQKHITYTQPAMGSRISRAFVSILADQYSAII